MVACPLGQAAINTAARGRVGVKSERDGMEKGCGNVKRKGFVFCTTCWSGSHTHIVIYTCGIHTLTVTPDTTELIQVLVKL